MNLDYYREKADRRMRLLSLDKVHDTRRRDAEGDECRARM